MAPATSAEDDPSRSASQRVLAALADRVGALSGELAAATGLGQRQVDGALAALRRRGVVVPVQLPSGHTGHRIRTNGQARAPGSPRAPTSQPRLDSTRAPTPDPLATADEHQRRRRRAAALREAADWLSDGGLRATIRDGALHIGGTLVPVPAAALDDSAERAAWLDRLVTTQFPEHLEQAVRERLGSDRADLRMLITQQGIVVTRRGVPLAAVTARRCRLRGRAPVSGNFLVNGPHWKTVLAALPPAPPATPAPPQVLTAFPDSTPEPLAAEAIAASGRLRTERSLVFAHTVRLETADASLRFDPLIAPPAPLEVPFEIVRGENRLDGGLRLRTPRDPLALVRRDASDDDFLGIAWPLALIAYAELTCVRDEPGTRREARPPASAPRRTAIGRAPRQPGTTRHGGQLTLSSALRPVGSTARYLASYVAGHRRRLRPGQRRSSDAERHARAVGIVLADSETWVRPHIRGVPANAELRFGWHAPAIVRSALANE